VPSNGFIDVTGDGKADAIVVNSNTITVRPSEAATIDLPWIQLSYQDFAPNEDWTHGSYYGAFFADVTGDGRADAIVVNNVLTSGFPGELISATVPVRTSDGSEFAPQDQHDWLVTSHDPTQFADVTGDGKADAIVADGGTITVYRSDGTRFLPGREAGPRGHTPGAGARSSPT